MLWEASVILSEQDRLAARSVPPAGSSSSAPIDCRVLEMIMANRKKIPAEIQNKVLTLSGRRCCLCFGLNPDFGVKKGQIAHLDHDPAHYDIDNLAYLCLDHHDEYDSRTRQSKGLTTGEVKRYRERTYQAVEDWRESQQPAHFQVLTRKPVSYLIGVLALIVVLASWYLIERSEKVAPYRRPIQTASATVEVIIESEEDLNANYMDRGGYLAFGLDSQALLTMSSTQCRASQTGEGTVLYRGVFNMDVEDPAAGKPVSFLQEAEYAQIKFLPMPKESKVLGGKATCIFNSEVRIQIAIPPQETTEGRISVRGLKEAFSGFPD